MIRSVGLPATTVIAPLPFVPAGTIAALANMPPPGEFRVLLGSEVAHSVARVLATVRRSNRACRFPAHGFHEDSSCRDAQEGVDGDRVMRPGLTVTATRFINE